MHSHVGHITHTVYMDKGCEFNSNLFQNYCYEYNITPIFPYNVTKAPLVVRCQRTLHGIMYRYMKQNNTKKYVEELEDIVKAFNSKVNRSIKMAPCDAYQPIKHSEVLRDLEFHYNKTIHSKRKLKFNIGDKVRISRLHLGNGQRKGVLFFIPYGHFITCN